VVLQTECTDAASITDAWIVPFQSALDQITSTSEGGVVEDDDNSMLMPPPQQRIWPRVWPGL
jgi:hypothetical protein